MRDPILTEHGKAEFQKAIQTAQDAATPIPMKTFTSGAKSTIQKPMYHLIPLTALELLAERFGYGAARHGERNYRKGGNDPEFINDRVNHLFEHVVNFAEHRRQEDLAAILCNAAILADIKAFINPDITKENS